MAVKETLVKVKLGEGVYNLASNITCDNGLNSETFKYTSSDNSYTIVDNLIEFDKYDAVVICTDRIRTPGTAEGLLWRVEHEFDGPVLIVGDEIHIGKVKPFAAPDGAHTARPPLLRFSAPEKRVPLSDGMR